MLNMIVGKCEDGNILTALRELGKTDNDFNGSKGEEYLWDDAKELGFISNLECAIDCVKDLSEYDMIEKFLDMWMWQDDFYLGYQFQLLYDSDGNPEYIVVAYISE